MADTTTAQAVKQSVDEFNQNKKSKRNSKQNKRF